MNRIARWLFPVLCLLVCAFPSMAQNTRVFGFCTPGSQKVSVQGLTQTSPPGVMGAYAGCTVTVYLTGTTNLATIFSNSGGTPLSNPFTANTSTAYWFFYASVGSDIDITISGAGLSVPFTYGDIIVGGGGGGGSSPAPPAGAVQFANPTVNALSSAQSGGNYLSVDSIAAPSLLRIPFNYCGSGPRPYIDVTCPPYNADPTGNNVVQTATGIQNAINAACATPTTPYGSRTSVFFPAGLYLMEQPQNPSTAPILTIPCSGLALIGGGSIQAGASGMPQFGPPGAGAVLESFGGFLPADNDAAVIGCSGGLGEISITNMEVNGHNKAVDFYDCDNVHFNNDLFSTGTTGHADNVPLLITNSDWIFGNNLYLSAGSSSQPCVTFAGNTPIAGEEPVTIIVDIEQGIWGGCSGAQYSQRVGEGVFVGDYIFKNITNEGTAGPMLTVTETSPGNMSVRFGPVIVDAALQVDIIGTPCYLQSTTLNGGFQNVSLRIPSGATNNVICAPSNQDARSSASMDTGLGAGFTDGNNNPVYTSLSLGNGLIEHVTNGGSLGTVTCSTYVSDCGNGANIGTAPGHAFFKAGNPHSTLALDGHEGVMWGSGTVAGYESGMRSNAEGSVDFTTAKLLPPTGFSGTATTGGTLTANTYYAAIWAEISSDCLTVSNHSAMAYAAGVAVGGGNNAINFTWTVPIAAPTAPTGYCMSISTTVPRPDQSYTTALSVSGGSTTSFLYTGQTQVNLGSVALPTSFMVPVHRFTYNALGIGTTSPAANSITLGVNGINGVLTHANTAPRTWTFPDATGTVPLLNLTQTWPSAQTFTDLVQTVNAIPFSTSPSVNLALGNNQQFSCTTAGAAITPSLTGAVKGTVFTVIFVQNGTTACTWTWPSNIHGGSTVSTTLSSVNVQQFVVSNNGTDAYAVAAGSVGMTGGTP